MICPQCNNPLPDGVTTCEHCAPASSSLPSPSLPFIQGSATVEHQSGGIVAGTYIGVMNVHNAPAPNTGLDTRAILHTTEPASGTSRPPRLFISYANKDAKWRDELLVHLKPMMRNDSLAEWNDTQIPAGALWSEEIEKALYEADAGVLLVTPDFLASDFIFRRELPVLLRKKILWVPVSASNWQETELKHYQATYDPSRPLAGLPKPKRDAAWVDICRKIKAALPHP